METLETETKTKNKWYTLKVLSNFEEKVKNLIEKGLEMEPSHGNYFYEVLMPSEMVTTIKQGKKRVRMKKLYPGYLFVNMDIFKEETEDETVLNPDAYYFITSINGVTGFIGDRNPVQLSKTEIETIKSHIEKTENNIKPKSYYDIGQKVTILDGPFVGLVGEIGKVDAENQKVSVLVSIFGRDTPVELENWQVEKYEEEKK